MYTACLMKLQIAVYRPTECLYTRFIKESFRSQLIKGYFTCTVPYSGYTVEKNHPILKQQVITFCIFLYSKVTGAGKKKSLFFFHF